MYARVELLLSNHQYEGIKPNQNKKGKSGLAYRNDF